MKNEIKCPNCGHSFQAADVIRTEVESELRLKMKDWQSKQNEDLKKKEEELQKKYSDDLNAQKKQLEELLRKNIASDFETQLRLLQEKDKSNEEKLKASREKELEFLKKERELNDKAAELHIEIQKQIAKERESIIESIKKQEAEKNELKSKEYEKKFEDQKKQLDEMQRKLQQGSMQMQGEVMELALEDLLRNEFRDDIIDEVQKGAKGADIVQTVVNPLKQICGKLIFESKRTKSFSDGWIEKLKEDQREEGAAIAILVTEVMPKEMTQFGRKEGVWVCTYNEVKSLVYVLREILLREFSVRSAEENKGDKMNLIYNYIISDEFRQRVEGIVEAFSSMRNDIEREKRLFTKTWKEREKQLEKVMNNTLNMYGSVKGIAGNAVGSVKSLELPDLEDEDGYTEIS